MKSGRISESTRAALARPATLAAAPGRASAAPQRHGRHAAQRTATGGGTPTTARGSPASGGEEPGGGRGVHGPVDAAWPGREGWSARRGTTRREVLFDWMPERNLFAIEVADPGSEHRAESLTRLTGDLTPQFASEGSTVAYDLAPAQQAISALDAQDLALARSSVFGEWRDQGGYLWIIEPAAGAPEAPKTAPLPEPESVRILRELAEKQSQLAALSGGEKVFVWENPETGEREEQSRFKRLADPWVYLGEESPGGAEAAERRGVLEAEIAALNQSLESMVMRETAPPLPKPEAETGVEAIRVTTQRNTDDSFFTYDEAVLQNGTVKAKRTLRSAADISGLPEAVIQQAIAEYHPPEWIVVSIARDRDSGEWLLKGSWWRMHVTYDGMDYEISSIHTPYDKPLNLRRDGQKAP